jgi:hypothetical protein
MSKLTKIVFKTAYFPRKKGEVAELDTKLADYYLSIGVAEMPCSECEGKPCSECEELAKANAEKSITEETQEKPKKKNK